MAFKHGLDGDTRFAGKWELTGRIVAETEKAILLEDGTGQQWLPRSKIEIELLSDDLVTVYLPEWLAKEKGYV